MEKNIKDYLHLYLGCDYVTPNSQGNVNAFTIGEILKYGIDARGMRLILRPLSDMTEEEVREYTKLDIFHDRNTGENAERFRYLISRGFDLFGLIEAKLAIDKNSLT